MWHYPGKGRYQSMRLPEYLHITHITFYAVPHSCTPIGQALPIAQTAVPFTDDIFQHMEDATTLCRTGIWSLPPVVFDEPAVAANKVDEPSVAADTSAISASIAPEEARDSILDCEADQPFELTMRTPLFHNEAKDTSLRELFYGSYEKGVTHFLKKRLLMSWACPSQLNDGTYVRRKPKLILTSGFLKNARDKHQLVMRRQARKAPSDRATQPGRKAKVVDTSLGARLTALEDNADVSRVDPGFFSWSNADSQMTYYDCQNEAAQSKMTTTYLSCVVQCPTDAGAAYRQRRAQSHQSGPDPKRVCRKRGSSGGGEQQDVCSPHEHPRDNRGARCRR
jgi:hypothetical protein